MSMLTRLCLSILVTFLSLPLSAAAAPQGWTVLLEPAQLANILAATPDVRILHVTGDYDAGHIPGAISAPYAQFRGPRENPGAVSSLEILSSVVQKLGVNADTPVVIVHAGSNSADFGAAARTYWTLKSLGIKNLALLNGGFEGWAGANLPVSTQANMVAASGFQPQWSDQWRVKTQEIETLLENDSTRLIDARTSDFYEGLQSSSARPGTIKGAGNLSFTSLFEGSRVKPPAQVSSILAAQTQQPAAVTISFCNTGHLAAINWFIMSELQGIPNTKLYAESMTEWSMADRPMDNEPNRLKHYWKMTTDWVGNLLGA
ncbi:MAG: sulfurtransferase [Gammaproteobacteria bacterium]